MTNYPPTDLGYSYRDFEPRAQQTSGLAITSFVLGLVCCVPLASVVALVLSIVAMVRVSGSQGRLKGTGFAIAGCILGLLGTVMWVGMWMGANSVTRWMFEPIGAATIAIQQEDYESARQYFGPELDQSVTDEQLRLFCSAYEAELGKFKSGPTTFLGWIMDMYKYIDGYPELEKRVDEAMYAEDQWVILGKFEKGGALLIVEGTSMDDENEDKAEQTFENLIIKTPNSEYSLKEAVDSQKDLKRKKSP